MLVERGLIEGALVTGGFSARLIFAKKLLNTNSNTNILPFDLLYKKIVITSF